MTRHEFDQMTMPCGHLWITRGEPVDNSASRVRDSTPFEKDKSFSMLEALVDSLMEAVQVLGAQLEDVQHRLDAFFDVIDRPLSPIESIERLKQLRNELADA